LKQSSLLRDILSRKGMSYEEISNAVAHIDSQTIIDLVALEYDRPVHRNLTGPKQYAAMMLYKVVYMRKKPSWACAFAMSEMLDYFTLKFSKYPSEGLWVLEEADQLELSQNYSKAELNTFLSLKMKLVRVGKHKMALENIKILEECIKEGLLDPSSQAAQIMPLQKACIFIEQRRVDEARSIVKEVYSRIDELDPSIQRDLKYGVEEFIRRRQHADIYPELYNPQTGRKNE